MKAHAIAEQRVRDAYNRLHRGREQERAPERGSHGSSKSPGSRPESESEPDTPASHMIATVNRLTRATIPAHARVCWSSANATYASAAIATRARVPRMRRRSRGLPGRRLPVRTALTTLG